MYGSQHPYPQASGQAYPEWQQQAAPPPPPPPPPPPQQPSSAGYNPNTYGPMPSVTPDPNVQATAGGVDTSSWGVRYNQYQYQYPGDQNTQTLPPPLPPRPDSAFDHSQSQHQAQPQNWGPAPQTTQPYYPPHTQGVGSQEPQGAFASQQAWQQPPPQYDASIGDNQATIPPPPPPIPPGYQAELQQNASAWNTGFSYSDAPPTHHYDPQQQQQQQQQQYGGPQQAAPGGYDNMGGYNYQYPPVSSAPDHLQSPPPDASLQPPIPLTGYTNVSPSPPNVSSFPPPATTTTVTSPIASTTASALGGGRPSDWEHFSTAVEDVDDTASFAKKDQSGAMPAMMEPPLNAAVSSPPPNTALGQSSAQTQRLPSPKPLDQHPNQPASPSQTFKPIVGVHDVSPATSHVDRTNSVDSAVTALSTDDKASGMIDGVIEAWSKPVPSEINHTVDSSKPISHTHSNTASTADHVRITTPVSQLRMSPQGTPSSILNKGDHPATHSVVTIADPYEDLDPWYKSSLTRYVTMLRKEMATESEEEKFKLFSAFMTKESKLRAILYNVEDLALAYPPVFKSAPNEAPKPSPIITDNLAQQGVDDVVSYSPGGRPILASALRHDSQLSATSDGLHRSASNPNPQLPNRLRSDSSSVAGVGSPIKSPNSALPRSISVPPGAGSSVDPAQGENALTVTAPHAVYTPFRYSEGPQRGSEALTFDRPAYQAYSALRQAGVDSGRIMSQSLIPASSTPQPSALDIPSSLRREHDETFLGLVREKSVAYRGNRSGSVLSNRPPTVDILKKGISTALLDELFALIPNPLPDSSADMRMSATRKELEGFSEDFGFIDKSIEAWDTSANNRQGQVDQQRRTRLEESERHIDSLFNDKEIGYSDINVLEDEFKQTEAQKQLNEERKEFTKYVEIVFTRVDERLAAEIASLQTLYHKTAELINPETAGAQKLARFQLSHAMRNAADIFQKLEARHEKRVQVVLERERRRKKAERRFYAFLGDTAALKQMEKDFTMLEQKTLLDAAKGRDERANKLMDLFDDASMRGIGENQRLLDDISSKINKFDKDMFNSSGNDLPSGAEDTIRSAMGFVGFLGADSDSILASFGVADRLLNDADFDVSVGEAKLANANADIFRRLEEEKKKEDGKIADDLASRMSSVKTSHEAIIANIDEVLESIVAVAERASSSAGDAAAAGASKPVDEVAKTADEQQQERLRKALEDAKRRNAGKAYP